MRRRDFLKAAPALMAPALAYAQARPLRYIPNAGLSTIDPIWTTALVAGIHGYMVFDTLYGLDDMGQSRPQMCAGHDVSADGLTWTFTLRDGLTFHDGERVLAKDCAMSVRRWCSRDSFGQPLLAATSDIETIDDRRFRIRLKRPFSQMLYGLGARGCFMMPERMAKTPGTEQIRETVGSGPIPLPSRPVGLGCQRSLCAVRRIRASAGTAELPGGRQGGECPTCRMGRAAGPGDRGGGPAKRRGRLARSAPRLIA